MGNRIESTNKQVKMMGGIVISEKDRICYDLCYKKIRSRVQEGAIVDFKDYAFLFTLPFEIDCRSMLQIYTKDTKAHGKDTTFQKLKSS